MEQFSLTNLNGNSNETIERDVLDLLIEEKRQHFTRFTPQETYDKYIKTAKHQVPEALLIDVRAQEQRLHDGLIPGAITTIRQDHVYWRVYPDSDYLDENLEPNNFDQQLIFLCNQGYSSSLIAGTLAEKGMTNVHDVVGGFEAWKETGLYYVKPTPLHHLARALIRLADKSAHANRH